MNPKPTAAQIKKLPVWAQEHIADLERERFVAIRQLNAFVDSNTPSNIYVASHECTGEGGVTCPVTKKHYLQAKRVNFMLPRDDMEMEVYVNVDKQRVEVRTPRGYPYIEPQGSNLFYLVARDSMLRPNAKGILLAMQDVDKLDHDDFVAKHGFSQAAIPEMIEQVIPAKGR